MPPPTATHAADEEARVVAPARRRRRQPVRVVGRRQLRLHHLILVRRPVGIAARCPGSREGPRRASSTRGPARGRGNPAAAAAWSAASPAFPGGGAGRWRGGGADRVGAAGRSAGGGSAAAARRRRGRRERERGEHEDTARRGERHGAILGVSRTGRRSRPSSVWPAERAPAWAWPAGRRVLDLRGLGRRGRGRRCRRGQRSRCRHRSRRGGRSARAAQPAWGRSAWARDRCRARRSRQDDRRPFGGRGDSLRRLGRAGGALREPVDEPGDPGHAHEQQQGREIGPPLLLFLLGAPAPRRHRPPRWAELPRGPRAPARSPPLPRPSARPYGGPPRGAAAAS